jgi:hypothetical protein
MTLSVEKCLCRSEHLGATLLEKVIAADEQSLATLGGSRRRTHRADQRGAALHAAMGDVFKIVGSGAAVRPCVRIWRGGSPYVSIRGLLGQAEPILTAGGRAMGDITDIFVGIDVAIAQCYRDCGW